MVWEDSSHGLDFQNGVHRQVERFPGNFEIVLDKSFAWMSTDFVPLLNRVKKAKADVFLSDAHLTDFVLMHHQYTQLGLSHLLVSYGARGSEEIAREELSSAVDYLVSIAWWSKDLPYPQVRKFINNYQTAYGSSPEWYAGTPYEAVRALLRAIEKAGSLDRAKIRDALAGLDMMNSTVAGQHLFFKKNGQANYPLLIIQNRPDGTVPIVHPADAAAAKATVPRPRVRFKVAVLHLGPIDDYGWTYQAHLGAQEMAEELPYVELSEEGCDVIANHSDSYAPAVAADERGVYYISLNSNLRRFAPHVFLAGAVWNWAPIMTDIVRIVREGTWDKHPGQDWWYGLAEEGVKLAPFSDLVPEDVRKMVEEKKQAIIQGEFQVFPGMSDKQLREIYHFESNVVGKLP